MSLAEPSVQAYWPSLRLADVADIVSGVTKGRKLDGRAVVEVPYLSVANVQAGFLNLSQIKSIPATADEIERYRLASGDIVVTEGGDPDKLGRGCMWSGELDPCIHQNHIFRIRVDRDRVIPQFLAAYLGTQPAKTYFLRAAKQTTGIASINMTQLRGLPVPLPPIPEQRRIAAILDQTDALRAKRRAALEKVGDLAPSLFLKMFGDPIANSKKWTLSTFASAGRVQLGRQRAPKYQTGKFKRPYVRVANVFENRVNISDLLFMDFDDRDFESYRLQHGDILLNEGQSTELVGRPAMWKSELEDCCFQNTLVRFQPDRNQITPEYSLALCLRYFRTGVFAKISSKTSNVAHLGASRFARLPVPLPPLELQRTFAEHISGIEELRANQDQSLAKLDALFASLQHRAFKGEL